MVSRKVLEDLLQQPLGPYRDRDILHERACQLKGATKLVLYSFVLEHNGHVIGYGHDPFSQGPSNGFLLSSSLDESEDPLQGQDDRTFRFRGILKITNPDWLSDFGLKTVETELNLRAKECALREGERWPSQLTLEGLFGNRPLTTSNDSSWRKEDETKLTVLIQGEKNMPAVYMHGTCPVILRLLGCCACILMIAHTHSFPCTKRTVLELESSVSVQKDITDCIC